MGEACGTLNLPPQGCGRANTLGAISATPFALLLPHWVRLDPHHIRLQPSSVIKLCLYALLRLCDPAAPIPTWIQ
jgi:hypothetical protein